VITAAYTICKNEIKYVEKWLYYTQHFNYRVILDTGSTDGTFEAFQEAQKTDPNLILEQKNFTPWKFNVARNYNLDMIPGNVEWCLSPDLDEYFSLNVLEKMEETIKNHPNVTNINCDRLDIYTRDVRVGPPKMLPTNKIHKRHDYIWVQPIYEHLWVKYPDTFKEIEIYNPEIYLIHDQDFKKKSRSELYIKMLEEEFDQNPTNCWTLWYLLEEYFKKQDLNNYVEKAIIFVKNSQKDDRLEKVKQVLHNIYTTVDITRDQKTTIFTTLKS
jgi:glycosyltransferase involved in cell wall biosynthesis